VDRGRIFYQFLGQVLRSLFIPLIVAYAVYEALAAVVPSFGRSLGLRPVFLELAYILGLVVAFAVLFIISRRTAASAVSAMPSGNPGHAAGREPYREDVAIRRLLEQDQPPPWPGPPHPSSWRCSSLPTPMLRRSPRSCVPTGGRR
jgi:hypothetical protein